MPHVSIDRLIAAIHQGDALISFPTDTVPALASRPDCADLIYTAKQRSFDKPLILMGAEAADLWPYTIGTPEEQATWQAVTDRHWPGALTLVLPASERLPQVMNPTDSGTIGIRVPDCAIARTILQQTGPLATTSVNRSGEPALLDFEAISAQFPEVLTLKPTETLTWGNSVPQRVSGQPSTVARWNQGQWEVLRQGAVTL